MSRRYTIKLVSGRRVKVKRWHIYSTSSKWHDFYARYQEQWETGGFGVHTHIWICNDANDPALVSLFEFIMYGGIFLLPTTEILAFIHNFDKNKEGEIDFNKPSYTIEFVVKRKVSQTLLNEIMGWLDLLVEEFHNANMVSLFGGEM